MNNLFNEDCLEALKKLPDCSVDGRKVPNASWNNLRLDPFAGSGTTLVAAKMLNRQYIGCEMSKEYCDIINARLTTIKEEKENTFFG